MGSCSGVQAATIRYLILDPKQPRKRLQLGQAHCEADNGIYLVCDRLSDARLLVSTETH